MSGDLLRHGAAFGNFDALKSLLEQGANPCSVDVSLTLQGVGFCRVGTTDEIDRQGFVLRQKSRIISSRERIHEAFRKPHDDVPNCSIQ